MEKNLNKELRKAVNRLADAMYPKLTVGKVYPDFKKDGRKAINPVRHYTVAQIIEVLEIVNSRMPDSKWQKDLTKLINKHLDNA